MATIYISPTGDDTGSGTIGDPLKTITRAYADSSSGGTIQMLDGAYSLDDEALDYVKFNADKNITITGNSSDNSAVTIDTKAGFPYCFYLGYCYYSSITISNLTINANGGKLFYYTQKDDGGNPHSADLYVTNCIINVDGSDTVLSTVTGTYTGSKREIIYSGCTINGITQTTSDYFLPNVKLTKFSISDCSLTSSLANTSRVPFRFTACDIDLVEISDSIVAIESTYDMISLSSTVAQVNISNSNLTKLKNAGTSSSIINIAANSVDKVVLDTVTVTQEECAAVLSSTYTNDELYIKDSNFSFTNSSSASPFVLANRFASVYVDNSTMSTDVDAGYVFAIGSEAENSTDNIESFVFTRNTLNDNTTSGIHGLLVGKGIVGGIVSGNKITCPESSTSTVNIGIVVKGDYCFIGNNTVLAERCIYFKAGESNICKNNTLIPHGNLSISCGIQYGNVLYDSVDYTTNMNRVFNNIVYCKNNAYAILVEDSGSATPVGNTNKTFFDNNCYWGFSYLVYDYNTTTGYSFAEKSNFWSSDIFPNNDENSITEDPIFKDAANGDYTPLNPNLEDMGAGGDFIGGSNTSVNITKVGGTGRFA